MRALRAIDWLLVFAVSGALACGGDKSEPAAVPAPPAAQPTPSAPVAPQALLPPATPDGEGIVRLSAGDQMRFNATRIEVKAGNVKIELKNGGTLPKEVMGHNLIVLKPGSDVNAFAARAAGAHATGYIPADAAEVLAHTKLLGPGESELLQLDARAAGTYPFLCSFPGHVALMNGQLVVQ
jgi:azurin